MNRILQFTISYLGLLPYIYFLSDLYLFKLIHPNIIINIQPTKAFLKKIGKIRTVFLDGNGNIIQEEPASNLMQNPINVMAWLIKNLKEKGISLKKGDRISLGSVGKLFPLKKETSYTYVLKGFDKELSLNISIN